ncbi:MAG: winged helix-turn-helix domain-containing protein [Saprospiraceae bacterium]|nr:winged helix-turn-helix domain-containing protein [Saprospiraceae bacterium]
MSTEASLVMGQSFLAQVRKLSRKSARAMIIRASRLQEVRPFGKGTNSVCKLVNHLGYVQIDTISVVQRAHHHVLWSRIPSYKVSHLDLHLARKRTIFEYWAHAAAYLPIDDYRFTSFTKKYFQSGLDAWPKPDRNMMKWVLTQVKERGPLMARDFEDSRSSRRGGWWDWKPAKRALERLFLEGALMVSSRKGFQKVYDIPERVLPADIDTSQPSDVEYADHLIDRYLLANGIGTIPQICYLRRGIKDLVNKRATQRLQDKDLIALQIEGCGDNIVYSTADQLEQKHRIPKRLTILSPFDNALIQRARIKELFQYDYKIECYVPREKRIRGYFCLPLLYGDRFIGCMDAKAIRSKERLVVRNLCLEKGRDIDLPTESVLIDTLIRFAKFNGCKTIGLDDHSHSNVQELLPFITRITS